MDTLIKKSIKDSATDKKKVLNKSSINGEKLVLISIIRERKN
jgi:hypothetical protein